MEGKSIREVSCGHMRVSWGRAWNDLDRWLSACGVFNGCDDDGNEWRLFDAHLTRPDFWNIIVKTKSLKWASRWSDRVNIVMLAFARSRPYQLVWCLTWQKSSNGVLLQTNSLNGIFLQVFLGMCYFCTWTSCMVPSPLALPRRSCHVKRDAQVAAAAWPSAYVERDAQGALARCAWRPEAPIKMAF